MELMNNKIKAKDVHIVEEMEVRHLLGDCVVSKCCCT